MLWLAVCAGAAALAVDEMFEIHEQTLYLFGEDDYIKFEIMLVAVAGLVMLHQIEKPSKGVIQLFSTGFMLHICYLVVDFGDGDFFQLPFMDITLYWAEEIFEMLAIQTYFAGLILFHTTQAQTTPQEYAGSEVHEKKARLMEANRKPA
ncbi:MAG: hypothetical protein E2O50_03700 [Gammaproteobacteria bacterium]|nr:MAG: hypothetical protein E2O50_03700 [Gammaproteobacteria bacterium]